MKIYKTRSTKTPSRANIGDAGIDFYVPDDFLTTAILPNHSVLIPSGIKAKVPAGYALIAFNKSGVSTKKKLTVGACVVDSSYEGEIHIHLINIGIEPQVISPGDKIIQFILIPVLEEQIEVCDSIDELFNNSISARGEGGFGSTDKK